jgi:hypothetical protein
VSRDSKVSTPVAPPAGVFENPVEGMFDARMLPKWAKTLLSSNRPGVDLPLVSLTAAYNATKHGIYRDLVERALRHPQTHNLALTGDFGSGKSSVLRGLRRWYWNWEFPFRHRRTIELALSSLTPGLQSDIRSQNPAETTQSNLIQKELVKQLLYQLPTRKTPRSRFVRASRPSVTRGTLVALSAVGATGLAWMVTLVAGWSTTLEARLLAAGLNVGWFWGGAAIALVVAALVAWWVMAGRYALRAGLKAGALTVSLDPDSSSYFDQYLDEIMYFFEASKARVVLIEDLDRFAHPAVFDTLRALNKLINSSRQVGRRVTFVYAISDSAIGRQTGGDKPGSADDKRCGCEPAASDLEMVNRTKYFDVIIPMVPFVSAQNARDLMMKVMEPHLFKADTQQGISPALIRLAARHVADMRTIWSIRNEFEVHLDRLVTSAKPAMSGINHDIVFSLVLMRATIPAEFEGIRSRTSCLDDLSKEWQGLVDHNLGKKTAALTATRAQLEHDAVRAVTAERAGKKLDDLRDTLSGLVPGAVRVEFDGPLQDEDLSEANGWAQIMAGSPLVVILLNNRGGAVTTLGFSRELLCQLTGFPMDLAQWEEMDKAEIQEEILTLEEDIRFLRHHDWKNMHRSDLVLEFLSNPKSPVGQDALKTAGVTFADLVKKHISSPLVRELIVEGYMTQHFAQYSATYYGHVVGPTAAEYIARAIEPGAPIIEYELPDAAVEEILREQGADGDSADLFEDPSIYNLDIVGYLIRIRPVAAGRVASQLGRRWGALETEFVGRFFQREKEAMALAGLMAPDWPQALRFTAVDVNATHETRAKLVDAVLGAITGGEREDLDAETGAYLSANYLALTNVTDPTDAARAKVVMGVFQAAGAAIPELSELSAVALEAATQYDIYPITAANLKAMGGPEQVALAALRDARPAAYRYATAHLDAYIQSLLELDPMAEVVRRPEDFVPILNGLGDLGDYDLADRVVLRTPDTCRIDSLKSLDDSWWPSIVKYDRTDPTFGNVETYVGQYGVDEDLAAFLAAHERVDMGSTAVPRERRQSVSTQILAERDEIPDVAIRVALAKSIHPEPLPVGAIARADANLVGPLLSAGLLEDEEDTFDPGLLDSWEDFESAVAASKAFGEFADASIMPPRFLAGILQSGRVEEATKNWLITDLVDLVSGAVAKDASEIALALARRGDLLDLRRIQGLQSAGASTPSMVELLAAQGDHLPIADLRVILAALPGDYARLSRGGKGIVRFGISESHRLILSRLEDVTHTGAKVKSRIIHGTNLEAQLQRG